MNISEFRRLYEGSIRALLDWDLLEAESAPVKLTVCSERRVLGDIHTVWYRSPSGEPGDWRNNEDNLQTVAEASRSPRSWTGPKRQLVRQFAEQNSRNLEPLIMTLPTYQIGTELILLDSTHRLIAAFKGDREIRALIIAVQGPVLPEVLPDLNRFLE